MDAKEQLYYLLDQYYKGNYATDVFTDEFNRIFDLEIDYETLSIKEYGLMRELSGVTGRFSKFEEDLKIQNAYSNEDEVKKKVCEVYLNIFTEI